MWNFHFPIYWKDNKTIKLVLFMYVKRKIKEAYKNSQTNKSFGSVMFSKIGPFSLTVF